MSFSALLLRNRMVEVGSRDYGLTNPTIDDKESAFRLPDELVNTKRSFFGVARRHVYNTSAVRLIKSAHFSGETGSLKAALFLQGPTCRNAYRSTTRIHRNNH